MIEEKLILHRINYVRLKLISIRNKNEYEKRKNLSIFNYKKLSEPIVRSYPFYFFYENNEYGNGKNIFNKLNFSKREVNRTIIEHGLFLGDIVHEKYRNISFDTLITFSEYRKTRILKQIDKKVICVGPYIKYADTLLTKSEVDKLKTELGKVLLVFPSHSIETVKSKFNVEELINKIETIKEHFDSVLVCMYWKDIQLNRAIPYENKGYKVVTAGYIKDYYFLNRLKTIISLSDCTMSNNVGTHVGYCVFMNKPHYIFNSKAENIAIGSDKKASRNELTKRTGAFLSSFEEAKYEIMDTFSTVTNTISNKQIEIVKKYWGDF